MAALSFEGVSKHYRGAYATSFREDARGAFGRIVGAHRHRPVIKAVNDVTFAVEAGESFALVGHNGAGKTTALKLATRVTYPTSGRVRIRGRIGALIEVGTGLHPELTGRENIHLYGSIMGLSRAHIRGRFSEIVEFSGISAALEQPLKQYSSGMQLRLGFSVAAFLEPDVLLVDEAISVGDAPFQAKCVERMQQLTQEGRTLVFVSHDMYAVEALCDRTVWMRNGSVVADGPTKEVAEAYLRSVSDDRVLVDHRTGAVETERLDLLAVTLHDAQGSEVAAATSGEPLTIRFHYRAKAKLPKPGFTLGISEGGPNCFTVASMVVDDRWLPDSIEGEGIVDLLLSDLPLQPRAYELWACVRTADGYSDYVPWQKLRWLSVEGDVEGVGAQALTASLTAAPVKVRHSWRVL